MIEPRHARSAISLLAGVLVLSAGSGESRAGDEIDEVGSLEDLDLVRLMGTKVITASKVARDIDDAPAVIEVVTAEDIRRYGYRSVSEVLQHVTGFYVIDDQVLPNVSVRGVAGGLLSESGMIKVMIDGQQVAFRTTAGNWLGLELIPMHAISRIEIVRGPASALYGADAFLGVVNVITRSAEELDTISAELGGAAMAARAGAFSPEHLDLHYEVVAGRRLGRFDLLVGITGERRDHAGLTLPATSPAREVPSYNAGSADSKGLRHDSVSFFGKANWALIKDELDLSASFALARIARGGDFAHWSQLAQGRDAQDRENGTLISLEQLRATIGADYRATPELRLRLQGAYFQGSPRDDDRIEVVSEFFYVRRPFSFQGFNASGEAFFAPNDALQFVAGAELVYDEELIPARLEIDKTTGEVFDVNPSAAPRRLLNPGAYLQADWRAVPRYLHFTGGLRWDHHNIYGNQLTGRAGVVSHWTDRFTTKLLYGSAFKAPSPLLLFASPLRPGDIIGNPQLEPQIVHTVEMQASWSPLRQLRLTSGIAYSLLLDRAEFRPKGINVAAENISSQKVISWETRADLRYRGWLRAYSSLDLQYGTRDLGQEGYQAQLIGSENVVHPLWIARAGASIDVPSLPLELSMQAMVVGPRRASDTNIYERGEDYSLPAYALLEAGIESDELRTLPFGKTRFSLHAYNLLDTRTPDPGFAGVDYPRMPLEVMLELSHTY